MSELSENQKAAAAHLNVIRDTEQAINDKLLELEALRYKASGAGAIRYDKVNVQTSPQNFMEQVICDIAELSAEVEEDRASVDELKGTAYAIIRRMPKADERTLLEWYYLNGLPMAAIMEKMHRSERSVYYLRMDALETYGGLL